MSIIVNSLRGDLVANSCSLLSSSITIQHSKSWHLLPPLATSLLSGLPDGTIPVDFFVLSNEDGEL